ncbi:phosphate ABC transporter substrate-binding protein PstS [Arenimonas aestuarii]
MFSSLKTKSRIAVLAVAAVLGTSAQAAEITGAGASFVFPTMSRWSADYNTATGHRVNYQSIGSGGGIAQIKANTVDFGSSDAPLKPDDLAASNLVQFPSVMGGIVPAFNVPGIAANGLKLDGATLANVYLGKITKWNDPAIAGLNPGVALPDLRITVVHRSDGSGTTFNFVNYLSKVSPEWQTKVGEGTSVRWPTGVGGKGNEGVTAYVKQIKGAIGYIELSYALTNKVAYATMKNANGNYVEASNASIQAAAASAEWGKAKDFYLVVTNAPGDDAWPIAATNFILMSKQPKNAEGNKAAREFFDWVYENGDDSATQLGYVPLPDALVEQIEAYWVTNFK